MVIDIPDSQREAFMTALEAVNDDGVPYTLGGAFALHHYSGYWRDTKDMDIFIEPRYIERTLHVLTEAGFDTVMLAEHWLGKAYQGDYFVDIIWGEGNWVDMVDRQWIERSERGEVFGIPVRFTPVEEVIWAKSYVAAHERFDGADILHLIQGVKGSLDWQHLLNRMGPHWQLLLVYINLFCFVYPSNRDYIPDWVIGELDRRFHEGLEEPPMTARLCRGTLLDRAAFVFDISEKGYLDPREALAERQGFRAEDVVEDRRLAGDSLHDHVLDQG